MGTAGSLIHRLFLFSIVVFPFSAAAVDFISQHQSLRDGQETIVSPGESFELGFFSPKSSKNRYVGIWYKNIPVPTVVWVANRQNPVTDSSGILSFDGNGNLVVLDGNRRILWSCNASVVLRNSTAVLKDSGNLVLQEEATDDGQPRILWQSFENPSDTCLPTMKIGVELNADKRQYATSWKSESDPSPGLISAGIELRVLQLPQVVINNGSRRIWRSGYWNGQIFIGIPNMGSSSNGVKISADYEESKIYLTYPSYYSSSITRFFVDWKGSVKRTVWDENSKKWLVNWIAPEKQCDFHSTCGPFGSCDSSSSPICRCLNGFKPKSKEEWERGNWTSGCVRRTQLQCKQGENTTTGDAKPDRFLKIGGVKLPDFADFLGDVPATNCEKKCFSNCSCVAFARVNGIGCMLWAGELIDIQYLSSGKEDLFIRLAGSEIGEKRSRRLWITIGAVPGAVICGTLASLLLWKCFAKHQGNEMAEVQNGTMLNAGALNDAVEQVRGLELPLFDLDTIETATNGFSDANKLGEGGFGPVYKGTLEEGQEIAVKRLSKSSGQGVKEFKNEVILISKLQHRNLVRLLGCCVECDEKMLVYEYMHNKSLDAFLFDPHKRGLLDWVRRFHIVEGIARGLLYLHRDSRLRIIHRDLKTSNIVLDNEMNPKISDFGMARVFAGNQTPTNTNRVVGTYGYMAPEYAMQGRFSEKSDVFSFGVVMLEIVSGRRNTGFYDDSHLNLIGYVWSLWNEAKELELVDPSLGDSFSTLEVQRCIHVGLLCLQERETERPTLSSVVLMLGDAACLPMPRQPAFSFATPRNSSPSHGEICSLNDVTITSLKGR